MLLALILRMGQDDRALLKLHARVDKLWGAREGVSIRNSENLKAGIHVIIGVSHETYFPGR
jgi:hypothetical protein